MNRSGGDRGDGVQFRRSSTVISRAPLIKHTTSSRMFSIFSSFSSSFSPSDSDSEDSAEPIRTSETPKTPPTLDSSSSSSLSGAAIGYNEDILLQILPYLPPKSLIRCGSVCKQWLSIISGADFHRLHDQVNPMTSTPAFLLFRRVKGIPPELNFVSPNEDYVNSMGNIVSKLSNWFDDDGIIDFHSCNGLFCMKFGFGCDRIEFVVYNPTTNKFRQIPMLGKTARGRLLRSSVVNIAFDPLNPARCKLVCVLTDNFEGEYRFVVYSSETGVWRESTKRLDILSQKYYFDRGVFWNGGLHWAAEWGSTVCFDIDHECVRSTMPALPALYDDSSQVCYFGVSGGELYLISASTAQKTVFNVFSLKVDYSKWDVKHRIDITLLSNFYSLLLDEELDPNKFDFHILRYDVDTREENVKLVLSTHRKIVCYDVNNMTVKELAEVEPEKERLSYPWMESSRYIMRDASKYMWREAYQHVETLANV